MHIQKWLEEMNKKNHRTLSRVNFLRFQNL